MTQRHTVGPWSASDLLLLDVGGEKTLAMMSIGLGAASDGGGIKLPALLPATREAVSPVKRNSPPSSSGEKEAGRAARVKTPRATLPLWPQVKSEMRGRLLSEPV